MFSKDIHSITKDFPPGWRVIPSTVLLNVYSVYDKEDNYIGYIDLAQGKFLPKVKTEQVH